MNESFDPLTDCSVLGSVIPLSELLLVSKAKNIFSLFNSNMVKPLFK